MVKIVSKGHTVTLEGTDFEDIIDAAGYGINYWCNKALVDIKESTYTVTEEESGDEFVVTPYQIEKTWGEILDGEHSIANYIRDYFRSGDVGDIDATAGDVLIQICCFGEIVYG
jgi:hypothetical protein